MAKLIAASLLAGAAAVIAGLLVYFHLSAPDVVVSPLVLDGASARIEVGRQQPGIEPDLVTDDTGLAVLRWPVPATGTAGFPYVRVVFEELPAMQSLVLFWKQAATGDQLHKFRVPGSPRSTEWLPLFHSSRWRGDITELGLILQGKPRQGLLLESVTLLPGTAADRFRVMLAHWFSTASWDHSSINSHWGARYNNRAGPTPVPVISLWLLLSLVFYRLFQSRSNAFGWTPIAAIFLVCWVSLDLIWQGKLLLQLRETHSLYAGKSNAEKRSAGIDADLYEFIAEANQRVPTGSRVFVSSSDDYRGMRGAYYLYPNNSYWRRSGSELPRRKAIHKHDYILVLPPTSLDFDPQNSVLATPRGDQFAVKLLLSRPAGALFQVL